MRKTLGVALAAGLIFGSSFLTAQAETVTFSGMLVDSAGTGFGNVVNLLSLQKTPTDSEGSEFGRVYWDGSQQTTGDATNTSKTWSVDELALKDIVEGDTLGLIFNVNEATPPKNLLLRDFEVVFQDDSNNSLNIPATFVVADYAGPFKEDGPPEGLRLPNVEGGTGTSGYLFYINLTDDEAATFFGTGTNRIGMRVSSDSPILDSEDGADNFFLAEITGEPTPLPIPAPSTLVGLLSMGAVGLVAVARRRRKAK